MTIWYPALASQSRTLLSKPESTEGVGMKGVLKG